MINNNYNIYDNNNYKKENQEKSNMSTNWKTSERYSTNTQCQKYLFFCNITTRRALTLTHKTGNDTME